MCGLGEPPNSHAAAGAQFSRPDKISSNVSWSHQDKGPLTRLLNRSCSVLISKGLHHRTQRHNRQFLINDWNGLAWDIFQARDRKRLPRTALEGR